MILGYARVSTKDQNFDGQLDALTAAGAERIFADTISGTARARPELDRLMTELRSGDIVVVTKYDRLARSLKDLLEIVDHVQVRGAGFRSLGEDIDTTSPAGRYFTCSHLLPSLSESGLSSGQRRDWRPLASEGASVEGPLPYLRYKLRKSVRCGTWTCARSLKLQPCSKSAQRPFGVSCRLPTETFRLVPWPSSRWHRARARQYKIYRIS